MFEMEELRDNLRITEAKLASALSQIEGLNATINRQGKNLLQITLERDKARACCGNLEAKINLNATRQNVPK